VTTFVTQAETEAAPSLPEEEVVVTEAQLIEPPNTYEIEMVLNQREPEVETDPEPVEISVETTFVTQASDPVETPAFTKELTTAIPFLTNKYELGPAAQLEVERVAELMVYHPESTVELTGHTDYTGEEDFNMILSHYRAEKIAEYLEMRGIDRERIKLDGKGESDPLAINSFSDGTDAMLGRYLNRTVKVRILGQLPLDAKLSGLYIPVNLMPNEDGTSLASEKEYHYTIQLKAARMPILESRFETIVDVSEYYCTDGYYRYTTNSFRTFLEARKRLLFLRKRGYPDAYIQTREWYEKAVK
jgi:outer membrane protein OmpA-like peptidoglycan-associated protein